MRVALATILVLLFIDDGLSESRTSLSVVESARRRGGLDQPLGWENGWGVAPGQLHQEVPNLIREGSGQDEMDGEERMERVGSGDGLGVDDEDLFVETSPEGLTAPESSIISGQPVESNGEARQDRAKDWSQEYEYDSDNYIELDDGINDDTAAQKPLPKFTTESQHVVVTEGSEIVLPCQVD